MITRRKLIKRSALMTALVSAGFMNEAFSAPTKKKLKIGACDWSIGKGSDVGAFELAKTIGLEGIQVNLGSESDGLRVRQAAVQQEYLAASKKTGIKIASLAIGELNDIPYKSEEKTEQWVWDSIEVAKNFNVKSILLAFFGNNDLRNDDKGKQEVVRRLKIVAPRAEKMGVTLGIESYLSAEEHMDIIQKVGSESIKVYYDFRNSADAGYDVVKEIKWLGKNAICELHIKENGELLGKGSMDWTAIFNTLAEMDYIGNGWMQIEWAKPKDIGVVESYRHNLQFLQDKLRNSK